MKRKRLLVNGALVVITVMVGWIIHKVTLLLYFDNQPYSYLQAFTLMMQHSSWFIKAMGILNYLVKPLFFFMVLWILKEAYLEYKKKGE